jgi:hypothetical protein
VSTSSSTSARCPRSGEGRCRSRAPPEQGSTSPSQTRADGGSGPRETDGRPLPSTEQAGRDRAEVRVALLPAPTAHLVVRPPQTLVRWVLLHPHVEAEAALQRLDGHILTVDPSVGAHQGQAVRFLSGWLPASPGRQRGTGHSATIDQAKHMAPLSPCGTVGVPIPAPSMGGARR